MLQTITGLTSASRAAPAVFALDLNCAIYHCVHSLQKRKPYQPDIQHRWESDLIQDVISYIKHMRTIVNPRETLYIAVDGVVPMAKIRQQRVRRFKSAVEADTEARIRADANNKVYEPQPRWDTNAITPGTKFMANLGIGLRTYAKTDTHIHVSPADEPGEGEQKIMAWIRDTSASDVVIYGLDADLIVLALWSHAVQTNRVDLFREEVEFNGQIKLDAHGYEQFLYLDICHLASVLHTTYGRPGQSIAAFLTDFVGMMNLLGNDFVPHGMGLKIKNEGVEYLLGIYKEVLRDPLVHLSGGIYAYVVNTLRQLFDTLNADEPTMILKNTRKKLESRVGSTPSKEPADQAMARYNDTPILLGAEHTIVHRLYPQVGDDKTRIALRGNWAAMYDKHALWDADLSIVATAYLESLGWTLAYYSGAPVDTEWYYPWLLPPRAETVVAKLRTIDTIPIPNRIRPILKPLEQLAMVLPERSFHLLPSEYLRLKEKYPHAWPERWGQFSMGRRFMWECEPLIPLIQPHQIRTWIEELYDE